MQYLNTIPITYFIISGLLALFFILAVIARMFPTRKGLIPIIGEAINAGLEFLLGEATNVVRLFFGWTEEVVDEYLSNEKILRGLKTTVLIFSGILVIASFYASFYASLDFVTKAGIDPAVAWALPLSIDGFVILTIVFNNYHAYKGESTKIGTIALLFFTSLSIYFNISHLGLEFDLVKITVGGIAPTIVFGGSEMLTMIIRAHTKRTNLVTTDMELRENIVSARKTLAEAQMKVDAHKGIIEGIDQEVKAFSDRRTEIKADISYLETVLEKLDQQFIAGVPNGYSRMDQVKTLMDQGLDQQEIADTLNVKPDTARAYIRNVNNGKA